jgi:hypothetical protein
MGDQAKITSIDVLERFRASLVVFMTKARRSLDQASDEVRRTGFWVQGEQRHHWEGQLRRRVKVLERAEAELMTAKFSSFRDNLAMEQSAVRKAKAAVDEAQGKLRLIKRWQQEFDRQADPILKRLSGLRQFLDQDLPAAVNYLHQAQITLASYADRANLAANTLNLPELPVEEPKP